MSIRLRIFTNFLTAILVLVAVGVAAGFLLFWVSANPYIGDRIGDNAGSIAAQYFLLGGIVIAVLTIIGALWLISVTVRHVTSPLGRLKKAASEIRDGNLDHELAVSGHDELAELAACFEQMRIRLKDTVRMQEKAEEERRAMMAYVTHDLQTPITSIVGYSEGILDGVADTPEKTKAYAEIIRNKARSLQSLAGDLSLLSRLENAQLPLDMADEDIGELVADLALEFAGNEPELKIKTQLTPGLRVAIDREKMARVLLNLFQNSVKYKKPDRSDLEIMITLVRQENTALLTVSDNGMGAANASKSELSQLFEPFYRSDASRGKQSGSGLGLTIARQLVQLHGGTIWIMNNPGGGLSVNIALPIAAAGNV